MKKKVVVLQIKKTNECFVYPSCSELVLHHNKEEIGITLGALWNGLGNGNGRFENKKCIVKYQSLSKK